ncbi:hypothetical protein EIP91_009264 [Steccherinum ochraceum]|uniref:Uncharacterized protein n=1 Tax=Steccherinum ochraceum TaxID=92696 RepID=A0A4R0R9Z8_9APHY|nr:hypothetical protein EIP91_009264 [Steccherinum ochraceum]
MTVAQLGLGPWYANQRHPIISEHHRSRIASSHYSLDTIDIDLESPAVARKAMADALSLANKRAIQAEFDAYTRKLVFARRRLNMYTFVARFPAEVLIEIFYHYQALCQEQEADVQGAHNGRPYLWLKVTHICYFWRYVALSDPLLWKRITVTNAACVKEMFRRAKNIRLSLKVTVSPLIDNHKMLQARINLAQRCLALLQRFDTIDILAGDTQDLVDLFRTAGSPVNLKTIIISTMGMPGMPEPPFNGTPAAFIKKPMPNLTFLQYQGPNFYWIEAGMRPTLTRLDIRNGQISGPVEMFTVAQIVRVLQTMPHLEKLTLIDIFSASQAECRTSSPIDMTVLRSVHIDGSAKHCANVLECLSLPTDAAFSFRIDSEAPFTRLMTAITAKLQTSTTPLRSISVLRADQNDNNVQFRTWRTLRTLTTIQDVSNSTSSPSHPTPALTMYITMQRTNTDAKIVEQVFTALPLDDVRTLYASRISGLTKPIWTKIAAQLPALRGARLKRNAAESLPEVLASSPQLPSKLHSTRTATAFYFPRLQTLLLDEVPFETTNNQGHSFLRRLTHAVMVRRSSRSPATSQIKKLMIQQCTDIVMGEVIDFKKIVPLVQWDGYELTLDDDDGLFDQFEGVGGKRGDDIVDAVQEYEG